MPGVDWPQIVDVALVVREVLDRRRADGVAEDVRARAASTSTRRSTPRWTYPQVRLAPRRRSPARSSAARRSSPPAGGGRRSGRASSSTSTRTPRTARSRRPTRCAPPRTPACRRRCGGTRCRASARRTSPLATVPERLRRPATRGRAWTAGADRSSALLALAEELGPAEKAPKGTGRRASHDAAHRDRPGADQGTRRSPASTRGRPSTPTSCRCSRTSDVLVDGMRGSSSIWYRVRVNLQHVPETQRPAQAELEVDHDPWAGYRGAQRRR